MRINNSNINNKCDRISTVVIGNGNYLRKTSHHLHESGVPMNELFWDMRRDGYAKSISMTDFRYVEYEDNINQRVWPFKKDRIG